MTVFKGFLTLIKRNLNMVILYLCIFIGMSVGLGRIQTGKQTKAYQTASVDIAVIDEDGSTLSEGLYNYLDGIHHLVSMENTKKDIQNSLFYRYVEYVIVIPEGYQEGFQNEQVKLKITKLPDSQSGTYIDTQINTFLNSVKVYNKSGYTMEEALSRAQELHEKEGNVKMLDKNGNGGNKEGYTYMFQYFPYMIISVLGYGLSAVFMRFRIREIRQRMLCSAISARRQNLENAAAFTVVGMVIWVFTIGITLLMYGSRFLASPNKWYFIINSFAMLIAALSMAFLLGIVIKKDTVLSSVINVISLGMSFLCGVFVPLELMGEGIRKAVQFLPVYWYEVINEMLGQFNELSSVMKQTIYKGVGIQFIFALACVFVGLMISRVRQQES